MKRLVVDLSAQTVTAYENASVFYTCECVSGDSSHPTPKGHFKIVRKNHPYTSHKYHVPMNYAMFFRDTGEALHQYHGPAPWLLLRAGRSLTTAVGSHGRKIAITPTRPPNPPLPGVNECNRLWVLKKAVIGMYSWLRLSLPSSFS